MWNTRTKKLFPYIPGEQPRDRKFIKLNTNENPYPPSPRVIDAIVKTAGDRLRLYPDPTSTELRAAIAERYGVKIEQVFAGNGSDEVLAFAFAAFFEDTVIFPDITYSFYPVYADLWGIPYQILPLKDDFSIDYADYCTVHISAIADLKCGGVIFPNPNAPTGRVLPVGDVLAIAEYRKDRVVIVDEAYAPFASAVSVVPYIEKYPNMLTVHTLSKAASLAGLRVGFAIGSEELIEGLCRVRDSFNSYSLDSLALAGAAAAIRDTEYYGEVIRKVVATRERVSASLVTLGYEVIPSEANFIFIRSKSLSGADFFATLREKGILVRHFNKPRIADFLRVSIGNDEDMDAFLEICREGR
jgi:histidinol-phosphate aminotransferase